MGGRVARDRGRPAGVAVFQCVGSADGRTQPLGKDPVAAWLYLEGMGNGRAYLPPDSEVWAK